MPRDPLEPLAKDVDQTSSVRYMTVVWLSAAAIIAYIQRNSIGVAESTIRADLGLSQSQMGWIISSFFWTYAIFQIPSGWLCQNWGSRKSLALYSVLWSIATLLFAMTWLTDLFAPGETSVSSNSSVTIVVVFFTWLLIARLLAGAGQAGIFPGAALIFSQWLPQTRRSMASGVLTGAMQAGGVIGTFLTGALIDDLGWRWLFVLYALPGFLWAWWFYRWFRDTPEDHRSVNAAELALIRESIPASTPADAANESKATPWALLCFSPAMWCICGQQFCRAFGYLFYASWFATYLQQARELTIAKSGWLGSIPLIGSMLAGPLGGIVADWILARTGSQRLSKQGVGVVSMLGCAACMLYGYTVRDATLAVFVIGAGAFCASLAGGISYSTTIDMGGKHVATIFATMNMSGNIGAAMSPILVPILLARSGNNWDLVFYLFAGIHVVAAFCWLFLNPHGTFAEQSLLRRDTKWPEKT